MLMIVSNIFLILHNTWSAETSRLSDADSNSIDSHSSMLLNNDNQFLLIVP